MMRRWTRQEIEDVMARRAKKETLQKVGEIYGVSKERIRHIEAKELRRLRRLELAKTSDNILECSIEALMMSERLTRCLKNESIELVKDIFNHSNEYLLATPNLGIKSFNELKNTLRRYGLENKMWSEKSNG